VTSFLKIKRTGYGFLIRKLKTFKKLRTMSGLGLLNQENLKMVENEELGMAFKDDAFLWV